MKIKYKFDRPKIVSFFTQREHNILFIFHDNKLTPTQMMNFWKTTPNAFRMKLLRDAMEKISGEKVDIFEYLVEKKS